MSRRKLTALTVAVVALASFGFLAPVSTFAGASPANNSVATQAQAAPAQESPGQEVTLGDFTVRLAAALQLPGPRGGFIPESAAAALWKVGVRVRPEFRKPLTESDVTSTLSQIGFNLVSVQPDRAVDSSHADAIISTFVGSGTLPERVKRNMVVAAGNGGDDFNNGNGKGGKFKRKGPKSPGSSGGG